MTNKATLKTTTKFLETALKNPPRGRRKSIHVFVEQILEWIKERCIGSNRKYMRKKFSSLNVEQILEWIKERGA